MLYEVITLGLGAVFRRMPHDGAVKVDDVEVDGARFGIDTQLPGLKVAVMARAPAKGAKPRQVDDRQAKRNNFV